MFGSMFALVTVTAAVLLVPAFAALLVVKRHRHVSPGEDSRRRVRLAVAAVFVALASLVVTALLDADVVSAVVVAVLLAGSVLVWAPLTGSWAVRGVVMWGLLVAAVLALLGGLVQEMVASSMSLTEVAVTAGVTLLLLVSLWRGHGYAEDAIAARAGLGSRSPAREGVPLLRPVVSLAVLMAAGGVVLAVSSDDAGTHQGRRPEAGQSGSTLAPGPPQPSTATTPTSGAPSMSMSPSPPQSPAASGGPTTGASPGVPGTQGGAATSIGAPPGPDLSRTVPPGSAAVGTSYVVEVPAARGSPAAGGMPAAGGVPAAPERTTAATTHARIGTRIVRPARTPTRHATPTAAPSIGAWDDVYPPTATGEPSGGPTTYPDPTHPGPSHPWPTDPWPTTLPPTDPWPTYPWPTSPWPTYPPPTYPWPTCPEPMLTSPYLPDRPLPPQASPYLPGPPVKTPGCAKGKPNHPAGAQAPGRGRQNRR